MNQSSFSSIGSPLYDQVLALLRSALWGEERFPYRAAEGIDWIEIYQELKQQTVHHIPVDLLARENPEHSQQYIALAARGMMRWYTIMQQQQEICQLLADAGIPCVVVKGAASACYYSRPSSRAMGDIDLLVNPEDFDRACSLIAEGAEYLGENVRHKEYRRNRIIVEIHRAFSHFTDPEKNLFFDQRVFGAIEASQTITTENYTFPCLPTVENGLILLAHIDVHLAGGLGLRQIIDWMMYVDRELTDEVWNNEFAPFVKQLERETLAITATRMCQMYLGLRTDITWCAGADEDLCRQLMEYILCQGNFGRKTEHGSNLAAGVVHASRNPFALLKILQRRGCINWKAAERYPFLKPFAWLYQLVRYIRLGLSSKHPWKLLTGAISQSDSRALFLEELGVSRMAEEGQQTNPKK